MASPPILLLVCFAGTALACYCAALLAREWWPATPAEEPLLKRTARLQLTGWDRYWLQLFRAAQLEFDLTQAACLVGLAGLSGGVLAILLFDHPLAAALGVLCGAALPVCVCQCLAARRLQQMQRAIPSALEALAEVARSGQGLVAALAAGSQESAGPLSKELREASEQLRLGLPVSHVAEQLAERVPLAEIRALATAMEIHQTTGGDLAKLTDRLATTARDREACLGQLAALSAGSRFSAWGLVLGTGMGLAVLHSLQPGYLTSLVTHPWGPGLITLSAALLAVGSLWTWRLLRLEY